MPSYSQEQENQQQEEYILIREWGSKGFSPGQFSQPADVAIDSKGNVYVSDLGANNHVVKFDNNGNLITMWGKWRYRRLSIHRVNFCYSGFSR